MPHSLTPRQREMLEFIKAYVAENESSPRLQEISQHFGIKAPTAHKILRALQRKGYIIFGRDKVTGFFIRLIEGAGRAERVVEVPIAGKVNSLAEVLSFPEHVGHFVTVIEGDEKTEVFALACIEDMPQASLQAGDLILLEMNRALQPGGIGLAILGKRFFLIKCASKTFDKELWSLDVAIEYPIPEKLQNRDLEQLVHWYPLAHDEETHSFFEKMMEEQGLPICPIPPFWVLAVAVRLTRKLAF